MNKVRIVRKPDGTTSIIYPAPKSRRPGEMEDRWLDRVFTKAMREAGLDGLPYEDVNDTDVQ